MVSRRELLLTSVALTALPLTACFGRGERLSSGGIGSPPQPAGFSLSDLERRTFQWFWDVGDPVTGLIPDRWPTPSFASIAAVGFALTAYPIGVERGWINREDAQLRTLATLRFLDRAPMGDTASGTAGHRGFFYHFLDMKTGTRFGKTELSSVDTALLMGGILFAAQYFAGPSAEDAEIRRLADALFGRVEWPWMQQDNGFVSMGWHPETGFIPHYWNIYNEALMLNIMALGSPTYPLDASLWPRLTQRFDASWGIHWGEEHLHFPPLFGHQYSHVWIDFRGITEPYIATKGIDYFENSRRATMAQRNYAIANPKGWAGYNGEVWGLTACDGPGDFTLEIDGKRREFHSYSARGPDDRDDGTIAPTAVGGSIAFAPDECTAALKAMYDRYGQAIYGDYGFWDSFNPTLTRVAATPKLLHGKVVEGLCWVDGDYLGIDQGPIVTMIANARDGFVWNTMHGCPHIRRGLQRAGFTGGWLNG